MNNTSLLIGYINGIGKETSLWIARVTVPLGILLNMISVYIFLRPNYELSYHVVGAGL